MEEKMIDNELYALLDSFNNNLKVLPIDYDVNKLVEICQLVQGPNDRFRLVWAPTAIERELNVLLNQFTLPANLGDIDAMGGFETGKFELLAYVECLRQKCLVEKMFVAKNRIFFRFKSL
jgi:hypothetical protein